MAVPKHLRQLNDSLWELPRSYRPDMRVPARIVASTRLLESMDAAVFDQIANVTTLPGIVGHAYCCLLYTSPSPRD